MFLKLDTTFNYMIYLFMIKRLFYKTKSIRP